MRMQKKHEKEKPGEMWMGKCLRVGKGGEGKAWGGVLGGKGVC